LWYHDASGDGDKHGESFVWSRLQMMTYKGYIGHVKFDDKADIFHGEVINTRDAITFQGSTVSGLKKAFHGSVDNYLALCKKHNGEPDRPFSGKFNLRIDPELHKKVYIAARKDNLSLNQWIDGAIRHRIEEQQL
jgi:predicted HicB family RNase H-like nuclease